MLTISSKGSFKKTEAFLGRIQKGGLLKSLDAYARVGVEALTSATPIESGETAAAWGYEIYQRGDVVTIAWTNSHIVDGVKIAIILQYGHGTGNGGYIQGRDYINPALAPTFNKIANQVWKAVTSA